MFDSRPFRLIFFAILVVVIACSALAYGQTAVQSWSLLVPTGPLPSHRNGPVAAYSPQSNRLILFAGYPDGSNPVNDLWVLTNANGLGVSQWIQLIPNGAPGSPPVRFAHQAAYDAGTNRLIVVGGFRIDTYPYPTLNDVWVLSNADGTGGQPTWTQIFPTGNYMPGRASAGSVYDPASNRFIMFLGTQGPCYFSNNCPFPSEVWALTNANNTGVDSPNWIKLSTAGTPPAGRMVDAYNPQYDNVNNRIVFFGGHFSGSSMANDVWVLTNANGLGGVPTWIQLTPSGNPPSRRYGSSGFYDATTNALFSFGGANEQYVPNNELWMLTNANGLGGIPAWQLITTSGMTIPPRYMDTGVYDALTNRLIIFGGWSQPFWTNQTWVLSNANGTSQSTLSIRNILPNHGGNAGSVTVQIIGSGFQAGANVKLTGSQTDIIATSVAVGDTTVLTATFDLTGVSTGQRAIIITNPDGSNVSLAAGFSVEAGGAPEISVSVIGGNNIRFDATEMYYAIIQNHGTIDAPDVAAYVNYEGQQVQSARPSSSQPSYGDPIPSCAFGGHVSAMSHVVVPCQLRGPSSDDVNRCKRVKPVVRAVRRDDSCIAFEAEKATLQAYINGLYVLRLANGMLRYVSVLPVSMGGTGVCFDPNNDVSASYCDALGVADDALDDFIRAGQSTQNGVCVVAALLGCPLDCFNPADINNLKILQGAMNGEVKTLKQLFAAQKKSQADLKLEFDRVALFQTQALALPGSLTFPPQPDPRTPGDLPEDQSSSMEVCGVGSLDPNVIAGPSGVGLLRYIPGEMPVSYQIAFENSPTASAPAQSVLVNDKLDPALNLATLSVGPITFLNHQVVPALVPLSLEPYMATVDLRPELNLLLEVYASLDTASRVVSWTFTSLDPSTRQPPSDPLVGFLSPGAEASVMFSVTPNRGLGSGIQIQNKAAIMFDANASMSTPTWLNTLDNSSPTSRISTLPATESCADFKIQWSGSDVGAGTQSFTVYSSDNGAGFVPWLTNTNATSSVFEGQLGHSYSFYSIARDLVGNVEPTKTSAEGTTRVTSVNSCGPPSLSGIANVVSHLNTTLSLKLALTNIGTSDALNTLIKTLTVRTLTGTGSVTLSNPQLPFIVGTVSVGNTITLPLTLNVPATVKKFSITESGTMQDSSGKTYSFSIGQNVVP